jgi:CBS-domain-containing membrane protein
MADEQIRRVPVVDENERLVGMIAQADLARSDSPRDFRDTVKDISKRGGDHTNL